MRERTSVHVAQLLRRFPDCKLHDVFESGEKTTFCFSAPKSSLAEIFESLLELNDLRIWRDTLAEQLLAVRGEKSKGMPFRLCVLTEEELKLVGVAFVSFLRRNDLLELEVAEQFLDAFGVSRS
ncbi:hypothetical protein GCM10028794_24020 [Silanimonas algicola]